MDECLKQSGGDVAGCQRLLQQYGNANQTQLDTSNATGFITSNQYTCPAGQTYSSTGNNGSGGCVTMPSYSSYSPPAASAGSGKMTYTPLEPLPDTEPDDAAYGSLSLYLNLVFKILLSIGAMIAVVTLVLGGITYMVSEIVDKKSEAKRRMQAALIGLFLLLTCWLILNEINPNLTKFSLPGIDQQVASQPASQTMTFGSAGVKGGETVTTGPSNSDFIACEGAEVPTGKHIFPLEAGGYLCK